MDHGNIAELVRLCAGIYLAIDGLIDLFSFLLQLMLPTWSSYMLVFVHFYL